MQFTDLVQKLGAAASSLTVLPDVHPDIVGVSQIDQAHPETISYIESSKYAADIDTTLASALVLPMDEVLQQRATARGIAWLATAYPRLTFAQAIALFYQPFRPEPGIHPTAVIHPTAQIGEHVHMGHHVVVMAGVKIGNGVSIHPKVVIYPEVQVGDRTILYAGSTIHERTHIGADCVIHSGAVIGAEGFGFVPSRQGWYKMQQSGNTVLDDGVEVGCNSAVDRPAVGKTRVGSNSKLDNQVHVGHNGHIGAHCAVAGQVGLAGAAKVGNQVLLGGQVGVANQSCIEDGVIATARAGIHSHVAAKSVMSGHPAILHKTWLKAAIVYSRLPEMYQALKNVTKSMSIK